jgi:hypothetical protein
MSSRKVVTRRGRRIRGYFPSHKCGRMIAWESLLERDAILLLEFSQGVVSYRHQPTVIDYSDGEQMRKYYPDFEVVLDGGEVIHLEIKPAAELALSAVSAKYRQIAADYQCRQQRFRILTDDEIRVEPLLGNLNTLFPLRGKPAQSEFSVRDWLATFGPTAVPFSVVENELGRAFLLRLLANDKVSCDLHQPLAGDTAVTINQGECHETLLP